MAANVENGAFNPRAVKRGQAHGIHQPSGSVTVNLGSEIGRFGLIVRVGGTTDQAHGIYPGKVIFLQRKMQHNAILLLFIF